VAIVEKDSYTRILFPRRRHVAGVKAAQVKNIVEWRDKNGPFANRQQLKQVRGIGEKTFKQCAGKRVLEPSPVIFLFQKSKITL